MLESQIIQGTLLVQGPLDHCTALLRSVYELSDVTMPGRWTPMQPEVGAVSCGKWTIKSIAEDVEPRLQRNTTFVTRRRM